MNWKLFGISVIGLVVFLSVDLCRSEEEDEDVFVTTEDEDTTVEEVPYSSPTPSGNVYLADHFDDQNNFKSKWVLSEAKKDDADEDIAKYDGEWSVEAPVKGGLGGDLGLVLKSKAKHAAISARLNRVFEFRDKPLVVQYEVTLQEGQECGGAYLKLLSDSKDSKDLRQFHDKTPYSIMFGPDKCGNDHKLHFIFRHRNPLNGTLSEKHCKKPKERIEEPFKDKQPHLYTLVLKPDNTFQISLDHKVINEGSLLQDFSPAVNPPDEIDDPEDRKPQDWDEREKIPDPSAVKPEDWDESAPEQTADASAVMPEGWLEDEPETIADPNAEKPEDWDTDMDGEWEAPLVTNPACEAAPGCGKWKAPLIPNPQYKGKWRAALIDNPNYKGKWAPRRVPNPGHFVDDQPFSSMPPISGVGLELWSMSNMILFDNMIVTDNPAVAYQWAVDTFNIKRKKLDKQAETFVTRLMNYTNEYPWLWAVYVLLVGIPVVLIVVFCCGGSSAEEKEQEERREAESKKTDAVSPDDEEPVEGEGEQEEEGVVEDQEEEEEVVVEQATRSKSKSGLDQPKPEVEPEVGEDPAGGDAPRSPRKRRQRKE